MVVRKLKLLSNGCGETFLGGGVVLDVNSDLTGFGKMRLGAQPARFPAQETEPPESERAVLMSISLPMITVQVLVNSRTIVELQMKSGASGEERMDSKPSDLSHNSFDTPLLAVYSDSLS